MIVSYAKNRLTKECRAHAQSLHIMSLTADQIDLTNITNLKAKKLALNFLRKFNLKKMSLNGYPNKVTPGGLPYLEE